MHRNLTAEEIQLDLEHLAGQIADAEYRLAQMKKRQRQYELLADANEVYSLVRTPERAAA